MIRIARIALILVVAAGGAHQAIADEEPAPLPPKKLNAMTLKRGVSTISATIETNLSKDSAFKPFSIAPDASYGVTDDLTVTVGHSGFMSSGFRGSAGNGLCLAGTDGGCANLYNNVGAEALYSMIKGPLAAAVLGGLYGAPLDPLWLQVKVGLKARYNRGKLFVSWTPFVFIGLNDREANAAGVPGNKGSLWSNFGVGFKATDELTLMLAGGPKGPLDGLADKFTIGLGVIGQYAIDKQLTLGASLFAPKIAGSTALPDAATGVDFRVAQIWVSYTR